MFYTLDSYLYTFYKLVIYATLLSIDEVTHHLERHRFLADVLE